MIYTCGTGILACVIKAPGVNIVSRRRACTSSALSASRKSKPLAFSLTDIGFDFSHTIPQILAEYGEKTAEQLEPRVQVRVAGRIILFARWARPVSRTCSQRWRAASDLCAEGRRPRKGLSRSISCSTLGDIIGVEGYLFRTRTDELSVHVEHLYFLAKTLLSMPEKWHGLEDVEIALSPALSGPDRESGGSQSLRHAREDLASLRRQLEARGFLEVETPMLQSIYGGAAARPFTTHHNTLDIDLYLRIAPELYLKRLVVGGLERVYEINRNFRNEGISTHHNPEFTMLEFYQAYTDYHGMMDLSEELLRQAAIDATGGTVVEYQGTRLDFGQYPPRLDARGRGRCQFERPRIGGSLRAQRRSRS